MIRINENYNRLQASYLFAMIEKKVKEYQAAHPDADIIKLGIGDVTRPLTPSVIKGFHEGVDEMARLETFRGYGPYEGYEFLREAIASVDFKSRGINVAADEIFVTDGAKSDSANLQELFADDIKIAVPDPVYPVYVDSNVMAGRSGAWNGERYSNLVYLESNVGNRFVPSCDGVKADLLYLCFPNNPTGATVTKAELASWVAHAKKTGALILFDAAYESFIRDPSLPRSIYEIPGADEVAVELRSFSKTAGFTGVRCGYTVIPRACRVKDQSGKEHLLKDLWLRRQSTKFNGLSYPVQKAAAAVFTPEGQKEVRELNDYYLGNAAVIRKGLTEAGYSCIGGENSPYIWLNAGGKSWDFFDLLLDKAHVVITPGSGFGRCGEGYLRISAFNNRDRVETAVERIVSQLKKR
jgi:LL-diaminopimelate aminotransferase